MMCRLFFLDWDGWGFASAVEQNFNPSKENIKHREALGESTEKSTTPENNTFSFVQVIHVCCRATC